MSDRPDGASAPRRHARRVTSAERLPRLTYNAESSPLIAAVERTPLTGADSSPLLAAADSSLLIATGENASLAAAVERAPPIALPPSAAAGIPIASPAPCP